METNVLHKHPEYMDECVEILNDEWSRSKSARLHSLQKSNDKFPISLVLVMKENRKDVVIGHSKLSAVQGKDNSCLIESVVIRKSLRGKGYGRLIMEESEKFISSKGFKTMYLTTHDKQEFYKHIGYTFCDPVISFGMNPSLIPDHLLQKMTSVQVKDVGSSSDKDLPLNNLSTKGSSGSDCAPSPSGAALPPPPAPPPPPPIQKSQDLVSKWDPRQVSWMKKELS